VNDNKSPIPVTKAVIAAAGFGTRFLPQTKAMPKEMLPLIDKPIIQYVVEELVAGGIKDIIIISGANKRSIEDHFDLPNQDLIANLEKGGPKKEPLLRQVEAIAGLANFVYIRQKGPYGNATPIACAAHLIGDEPFIYTYADDFFVSNPGRTQQLIDAYNTYGGSVLACKAAESDGEYDRYGFAAGEQLADGILKVSKIVEKPGKEQAPSNMASVSGYLLTPDIFRYIDRAMDNFSDDQGELMVQPIMQAMIEDQLPFFACEIKNGTYYDTGDKLEYIKTVVSFALDNPDMSAELHEFMRNKLQ
jgi:UTP--glucose-1-phosphate uridylyltransferase